MPSPTALSSRRWSRNWAWCLRPITVDHYQQWVRLWTFGYHAREFFPPLPPLHQLDLPLHLLHHIHSPPKSRLSSRLPESGFATPAIDSMRYSSWGCKLSCLQGWFAKTATSFKENEGNTMHTLNPVLADKQSADGKCWSPGSWTGYRYSSIFSTFDRLG